MIEVSFLVLFSLSLYILWTLSKLPVILDSSKTYLLALLSCLDFSLCLSFFRIQSYLYVSRMSKPKLVAFDLDGTVWTPDMYQLWSGGAPFRPSDPQSELLDKSGQSVRLIGAIGSILHALRYEDQWQGTKVAWVSCTDEPSWANECLRLFQSTPTPMSSQNLPVALIELAHSSEIYKANKQTHMRNLQKKFPDIAFEEMIFFDNEKHNTDSTSKLGVVSVHCPHGMLDTVWHAALDNFSRKSPQKVGT